MVSYWSWLKRKGTVEGKEFTMAKGRLKLGIVGAGRIATAHASAIIELRDQVELWGIAEPQGDRGKEFARKFGVEKIYPDYQNLLADQEVEAVIVCLPHHLHHPVCMEAARASKHILVEKPMAMNLREADEMVEEARTHGVTFMVGQSRRFSDAMKEIFSRLDEIGSPFRLDISFLLSFPQPAAGWWRDSERAGGLVILLDGSHSVDTIIWLLNKTPSTVFSISRRRSSLWEGEDEADIVLGYESGELATVHLSLNTKPYLHEAILVGPKGTMKLFEFPTGKPFDFSYRLDINGKTVLDGPQIPSLFTVQLREFLDAIRESRLPIASGEEVRRTVLVMDAIRKSDREGNVVRLE
jgi:UDP-N-acetyl-2-amino-2-deoxyglucuronate dehydrogenase